MQLKMKRLETDILVIGGGTAGCYAALTAAEQGAPRVIIAEKAHIKRSGCLAAGVNALNAYIVDGETPESYLDYVRNDAEGVVREDLVYTLAQRLNKVTAKLEQLGLVIQKDENGNYVARGKRNIKINGENIKVLLADAVAKEPAITVINRLNVVDYIIVRGKVVGAYGFSSEEALFYVVAAKAVICATGGAAGLYRSNNPGFSRHKMWYSPFNTGAGYAMGIRAGAEMTTLEMRFIALRCKDTIAPTGTIAQGVGAQQINRYGEEYERGSGVSKTALRLHLTVEQIQQGKGPCFLHTQGITRQQEADLLKAYLNMAPAQTLRWMERGKGPSKENVEIEGTEPYIVGGHTGSGYWIDTNRATTLPGLYAAGDVAGGSPQKYVTGCFAEGEIAAQAALEYMAGENQVYPKAAEVEARLQEINRFLAKEAGLYSVEELEEAMQKTMDIYAGGISVQYAYNRSQLKLASERIAELQLLSRSLKAEDGYGLLQIYELLDRLQVCQALIVHLGARQETRWPSFQENRDFPGRDDQNWLKFVNTQLVDGEIKVVYRELVTKEERYEHKNRC